VTCERKNTPVLVDGRAAGANVGTGGWFVGGLASGAVLSYVGAGFTYALAASSNVTVPPDKQLLITTQPVAYQRGTVADLSGRQPDVIRRST
jgi:hypothetical protein